MAVSPMLMLGIPLPPAALNVLQEAGLLPTLAPDAPSSASLISPPTLERLTPVQGQIWSALTRRPLNDNQSGTLMVYWHAYQAGEPALAIEEVARRLATQDGLQQQRAIDLVKGALRSFGRRLFQTLDRIPLQIGQDRMGDGVADEIPLLALLSISTGPLGEARHRLTADGAAAVAVALGLGTGNAGNGQDVLEDPNTIVAMGMSAHSAAMLLRIQRTLGISMDEVIQRLTAQAGAG